MTRTVFCRKYKQELEGLERPPYPGALGQEIYDNVSKKAWQEWTDHQTMLINEKHPEPDGSGKPQVPPGGDGEVSVR